MRPCPVLLKFFAHAFGNQVHRQADVFVVTMAPGLRYCATRASNFRLISRFSATTSIIQSASAQRARSSSKLPIAIFPASAAVKSGWLRFLRGIQSSAHDLLRSPADASTGRFGGTMSNKMHGRPAFAKCAAIREPWFLLPAHCLFDATIHGTPFLPDLRGF